MMDHHEPDSTLQRLAARLEQCCGSAGLRQSLQAVLVRRLIGWLQTGRIDPETARFIDQHPGWFAAHLPLRLLPARWHCFVCDPRQLPRHIESRLRLLGREVMAMAALASPQPSGYLHVPVVVGLVWAFLIGMHQMHYQRVGTVPTSSNLWYLKSLWGISAPLLCGGLIAGFGGRMRFFKTIGLGMLGGFAAGVLYSIGAFYLEKTWRQDYMPSLAVPLAVRLLVFIPLSGLSAAMYEYFLFVMRSKAGKDS